ncbi:sugar O-acyltransferase (sialic acid O-acetyltransferase NeuD family) [Tenacibaculum skagerrakense]|uniref:Sugar O-acyltransferase (Sialic acid O-acetyltransferase NeuD family) n=1 Tax=Tenacibaculum skagerrakense TaxID=186571 RepID=A0A4R2NNP3_9FLAO|nr:acetyltransferase [Tenacibaculum skagerrakense]TCP22928.1 sugar O-acyltransferase (sialic acid O-acetyltransferase NeuD family) [Tenacibaculum skagerrakense]
MKNIAVIGSGGLGREVLGIIQSINRKENSWNFIGFYDDNLSNDLINGFPILGKIEELNQINEELYVVIAIGNPKIKELIKNKIFNSQIKFPTLIHPSVEIYSEENVVLGKGVVIAANSVLTVNIEISDFVYINTAVVIAHDTKIGKYSMIMPTVSISAGGEIGEKVYIGNGTKIDYAIQIDDNAVIKAGSILTS